MLWQSGEVVWKSWGCRGGLALLKQFSEGSYSYRRISAVIVFNQIGGMDLTSQLPRIVVMGVPYPLDQILELF
jgi:hypothetical protein